MSELRPEGGPTLPVISDELRDQVAFRAKRELRKRLRGVRAAMPASAIADRSAAITERVLSLEAWKRANTVALFASMPDEVQCKALVDAARAAGKRVALPAVIDEEPGLVFRAPWDGGEDRPLVTSMYGIDEPSADAPRVPFESVELVVVPALALDDRGHRIGYGKGYYDRVLPLCSQARWVGVAFDFQLIAEVPTRVGDVAVHSVVTDKRAYDSAL
jgi:5-formyltetrahydrofolate cyclo-ligase